MRSAKNWGFTNYALAGFVAITGIGLSVRQAEATTASGHAYDLSVNVNVVGLDALNVAPQAEVQFPAQSAAYMDSDYVLQLEQVSALNLISLSTGELNAAIDWMPGDSFSIVGAESSVDGLDLGAVSLLNAPLLSLQTGLVKATAMVSGFCPIAAPKPKLLGVTPPPIHDRIGSWIFAYGFDEQNLIDGGDIDVSEGVALSVTGNPLLNIPTNPAPNTTLDLLGLATLVLNERNVSGDGVNERGVSINAIHLTVNVVNLITADVIVAHSEAAISCD